MTQTAVVILNFNGKAWLKKFLPSVIQYSTSAKIIVADNHSTDGSMELVAAEFPQVGCIFMSENLGFCGGYNYALKQIEASYYVLLNSDAEVTEGWLEPMIALLEKDSSIAAVQPKILSYSDKESFEYAGAAGGFIDALGYPFCRGRIFNSLEKDMGQYDDTVPVFWATGACMVVRSELYWKMNGLDEDFFAHMEEIDMCWKLNRAGYQVYYQGQSTIYHVGGGTLAASNPRKTYLNFRNGLSLVIRHFNTAELLYKLPLRILFDWLAIVKFLLEGAVQDAGAILKAHAHIIGKFGKELGKRRELKSKLPGYRVKWLYPRLIVIDFYLRGKKFFNQVHF
jgi:GT2 family glycosyltransferase